VNRAGVNSTPTLAALEGEARVKMERLRAELTALPTEVMECSAAHEEMGNQSRNLAMQLHEADCALATSRMDGAGLQGHIEVLRAEKRDLVAEFRGNAGPTPSARK
jgi:chromosome segregation ATPase